MFNKTIRNTDPFHLCLVFVLGHEFEYCAAHTTSNRAIFNSDDLLMFIKDLLQQLLHQVFTEYDWKLDHWVILDNHYHLLVNSCKGQDLPRIISKIHNQSAQGINQLFLSQQSTQKKVWSNYWDYCPRDEQDYNLRLCYLLNNPVKHGFVDTASNYPNNQAPLRWRHAWPVLT